MKCFLHSSMAQFWLVLVPGLLLGGKMGTVSRRICGLMALAVLVSGVAIQAKVIVVSTTIQAAVNAASSGDIVSVPAGTYRESVLVTKSGITIEGSRDAVLDGAGLAGNTGILGNVVPPPESRALRSPV